MKKKSEYLDPLISFEVEGRKRVRTFNLSSSSDTAEYEEIMNNRDRFSIIRENQTTDRTGRPMITVWWAEIIE